MRGRFPKFLKTNPTFWGMNFVDIGIIGLGMFVTQLLGRQALWGLVFTLGIVASLKLYGRFIDLGALRVSSFKGRSLDWMDKVRGI